MYKSTVEITRTKNNEFRWRLRASNGKLVAGPGESYKRKAYTIKAAIKHNPGCIVIDLDKKKK